MEYALRAPRGTHAEDGRSLNPCFNGSAFFEGLIESTPFASQSQPALRATRCYVVASNLFANFLVLMEYALRGEQEDRKYNEVTVLILVLMEVL